MDLIIVDGPNLYNSAARFVAKQVNAEVARAYMKSWFDVDRLCAATTEHEVPPRLGTVVFHSKKALGGSKNVQLKQQEVVEFWARQGSNPFCSTEIVELPGMQEEVTEAVCPTCDAKLSCPACKTPGRVEERREKGVDTAITTYLLETSDRWDSVCIVSGDADFVPPVRTLKRKGKQVFCAVDPGGGMRDLAQVCTSHYASTSNFSSATSSVLRLSGLEDISTSNWKGCRLSRPLRRRRFRQGTVREFRRRSLCILGPGCLSGKTQSSCRRG